MSRSIEDLLVWGEYCGSRYRNTEIFCTRNEHQKDTPHRHENFEWWPNESNDDK